MGRYEIDFSGASGCDVADLFPDGPDVPTFTDLVGLLKGSRQREFLHDWNFAADLTITVTDTVTGGTVVHDGFRDRWDVSVEPSGEVAS